MHSAQTKFLKLIFVFLVIEGLQLFIQFETAYVNWKFHFEKKKKNKNEIAKIAQRPNDSATTNGALCYRIKKFKPCF